MKQCSIACRKHLCSYVANTVKRVKENMGACPPFKTTTSCSTLNNQPLCISVN